MEQETNQEEEEAELTNRTLGKREREREGKRSGR